MRTVRVQMYGISQQDREHHWHTVTKKKKDKTSETKILML